MKIFEDMKKRGKRGEMRDLMKIDIEDIKKRGMKEG